ncbi:MAG: PP2C family protein-serine/threonine phosphatase [Acidimicrobiia bacterium]
MSTSVARRSIRAEPAWRFHVLATAVLVAGFAMTVVLALSARAVNNSNENRLLRERIQEADAAITAAIPSIETPLASAAEVAEATNASGASFSQVIAPLVGPGRAFVSAAIWPVKSTGLPQPLVIIGGRPELEAAGPVFVRGLLARAVRAPQLTVVGLFNSSNPRLAYAFASAHGAVRYVAYAESILVRNQRSAVIQKNSAFADLGYALYLGTSAKPQTLLATNVHQLPIRGRRTGVTVPFGDNQLRLIMTPIGELGGSLLARLQWMLLGFGLLLSLGAAGLTERLVRRREYAQRLAEELGEIADENARLYAAQRTVAQTLQHSLLPEALPDIPGLAVEARYIAGVADIDIGGDWYDVIDFDNGKVLFVVGDVSGRGLPAATVMASLRYATRAYAVERNDPATILTKLAALINVVVDGHFATVLCGVIDVGRHEVTLANAGHPEPLLIADGNTRFVSTNVGVPIGVRSLKPYVPVRITVPAAATLLAYTDGLVERRGEHLEIGLRRLRDTADKPHLSVDGLLTDLAENLRPDGPSDDIAILAVKWMM